MATLDSKKPGLTADDLLHLLAGRLREINPEQFNKIKEVLQDQQVVDALNNQFGTTTRIEVGDTKKWVSPHKVTIVLTDRESSEPFDEATPVNAASVRRANGFIADYIRDQRRLGLETFRIPRNGLSKVPQGTIIAAPGHPLPGSTPAQGQPTTVSSTEQQPKQAQPSSSKAPGT